MTRRDDDTPSLADHIRQAAKVSGLSVYRLAKDAGVDQSTLNKFLTGTRNNLTLDVADRLFQLLGLSVVRKVTRKAKPPAESR